MLRCVVKAAMVAVLLPYGVDASIRIKSSQEETAAVDADRQSVQKRGQMQVNPEDLWIVGLIFLLVLLFGAAHLFDDSQNTCLLPGCGKPTWNDQPNEYCSRGHKKQHSQNTCLLPGCGKPTWNGQHNEYCSRGHKSQASSGLPQGARKPNDYGSTGHRQQGFAPAQASSGLPQGARKPNDYGSTGHRQQRFAPASSPAFAPQAGTMPAAFASPAFAGTMPSSHASAYPQAVAHFAGTAPASSLS